MEIKLSRGLLPYVQLCEAVGLVPRTMKPMDIYLVAGKIINDRALTQLCEPHVREGVLPNGTRLNVIRQMSSEDVSALRERVTK